MVKTEKQKMLDGELYKPNNKELVLLRNEARKSFRKYNLKPDGKILENLFKQPLRNVIIEPPFYCDYGENIEFGKNIFINFNCIFLDCAKIKIGDKTLFGPNVQLYTPEHPIDPTERRKGKESARPITIGKNCWIGGGAIILAGVSIGNNSIIGAGSVVTKSIPANSLAIGNPCKVIKKI